MPGRVEFEHRARAEAKESDELRTALISLKIMEQIVKLQLLLKEAKGKRDD